MKNLILTVSFALTTIFVNAQSTTKYETLAEGSVFSWKIERTIRNEKDTSAYFYWGFQNRKYQQITDIASVLFSSKSDLETFANKLKELANMEKGTQMAVTIKSVEIRIVDFSSSVYIESLNDGYTYMNRNKAIQFADEILANSYLLK